MKFLHGKNHSQTSDFNYLSWSELVEKIKNPPQLGSRTPAAAKDTSEILGCSDATTKRKADIIDHNSFTLLRLDVDDTTLEIEAIKEVLTGHQIESFIIHTTASHKPNSELNRYRVYIELGCSVGLNEWQAVTSYLGSIVGGDECAERPQQITYLPFYQNGYEYHVSQGKALHLVGSELLAASFQYVSDIEKRQAEEAKGYASEFTPERELSINLVGNQHSLIDAFNASISFAEMLSSYGWKKQGTRWLFPHSQSGKAGGFTFLSNKTGRELYFSSGSNEREFLGGKAVDKFGLYCLINGVPCSEVHDTRKGVHNPSIRKILSELGQRPEFKSISAFNRAEYAIVKNNEGCA